jgi:Interferon-induced transmembrane protein
MMPGMGGDVNTTLPLILSIVAIFPCGCSLCIGSILGIVGLVFAIQAMNAKKVGDFATAQSKAKLATILSGIGIGIGLLLWIINLATGMAQGMMENMN